MMKYTTGIAVIKQMKQNSFKEKKFQGSNYTQARL